MYSPYPQAADLVPGMHTNPNAAPPSQGSHNKCQTYAVALALEILHQRAGSPITINRDVLYWMAKFFSVSGDNGDNGASVDATARGIAHWGVPTHPTWRDYSDMYTDPPADVIAQAAGYKGVVIQTVPYIRFGPARDNIIETLRMLFAAGQPVIATYRLNDSFDQNAGGYWDWRQTQWDGSYATGGNSRGDHVVTLLGIDMASQRVLAANHWGEHWGDGGFFGIPFDKFLPGPQGCVTNLQSVWACAVQPFASFNVMSNPVPTALTTEQQQRFATRAIAKLRAAHTANGWPGALGTACDLMGLSDKQFEMWAPPWDGGPGHGLPRGTVLALNNVGTIQMPASFFEPDA